MRNTVFTAILLSILFIQAYPADGNVEKAVRFRTTQSNSEIVNTNAAVNFNTEDFSKLVVLQTKSSVQLEELGSRWGWIKSTSQLEELGSRWGWIKSTSQLEELGSRWGWIKSTSQLDELGSRWGWIK